MVEVINSTDPEMLLRLIIAAILGLALGIERELKRKALGLKTILVISIGSCLLTIVSIQSAYVFEGSDLIDIRMDPLRLAAQIVSGVGFLGAGVILRREDETISGLTTAAVVWGAAGVGIATGAGFYVESVIGVLLLLFSVELIPYMVKVIGVNKLHLKEASVRLTIKNKEYIGEVIEKVRKEVIEVDHYRIKDLQGQSCLLVLTIMVGEKKETHDIYTKMVNIDQVENIDLRV